MTITPWGEVIPDKPKPAPQGPLLEVKDLHVHFRTDEGRVYAVNGVSYEVAPGESLAIVGESGCGKSVTSMTILRLIKTPPGIIAGGQVLYRGQDLLKIKARELRQVRGGKISMIFQDPMTSLNPFLTIRRQLTEAIELHLGLKGEAAREKAIDALRQVGIPAPEKRFGEYVQVSVGQAGPVYKSRTDSPYWKSDPNFDAILQNILRSVNIGYPGPMTPAAAEVQGQKILTDMAGRVVTAGLSPEAALKEAHARVEEIYKIRRS